MSPSSSRSRYRPSAWPARSAPAAGRCCATVCVCSTCIAATASRPGHKSLAYALTYQADDRTLTDKEVNKAHEKIVGRLKHVLKAQIRDKVGRQACPRFHPRLPNVPTVEGFLKTVLKSGLLDRGQLQEALRDVPKGPARRSATPWPIISFARASCRASRRARSCAAPGRDCCWTIFRCFRPSAAAA